MAGAVAEEFFGVRFHVLVFGQADGDIVLCGSAQGGGTGQVFPFGEADGGLPGNQADGIGVFADGWEFLKGFGVFH